MTNRPGRGDNTREVLVGNTEVIHGPTLAIRRAIWKQVRKDIHGTPWDGYIFSGVAFKNIRYGNAQLHEPSSWKPHQLAISLLSFERQEAYQTLEKKIKPTKDTTGRI